MTLGALGFHVCQVNNGAVICDEGSTQRQNGVLHPKALCRWAFKDKNHSFVHGHFAPEHEANLTLLGGLGHLSVDLKHAGLNHGAGQVQLGGLLREGGALKRDRKNAKTTTQGSSTKLVRADVGVEPFKAKRRSKGFA